MPFSRTPSPFGRRLFGGVLAFTLGVSALGVGVGGRSLAIEIDFDDAAGGGGSEDWVGRVALEHHVVGEGGAEAEVGAEQR